jgi:hypothetical protein
MTMDIKLQAGAFAFNVCSMTTYNQPVLILIHITTFSKYQTGAFAFAVCMWL